MKKIISLILLFALLGCTTKKEVDDIGIRVISPKGSPAISVLNYATNNQDLVKFVDGPDLLQAAFVSPNSEYDVIVAPINLGAKLLELKKSEYKLASIVTWGNLYIVGEEMDGKLAAFGQSSVPGLLLEKAISLGKIDAEVQYFNSKFDAATYLLNGDVKRALLPYPDAYTTIKKSKEIDPTSSIKVLGDLQEMLSEEFGGYGYPQAAIFIKQSFYESHSEAVDKFLKDIEEYCTNLTSEILSENLNTISFDEVGMPKLEINELNEIYKLMNVEYKEAFSEKDKVDAFLKEFGIKISDEDYLFNK
ncbi:MAG: hypothetical protein ACK5KQ_06240 [Anaerorhabdus sp.]